MQSISLCSDKNTFKCVEKWHETPDAVSVKLATSYGRPHFSFKPGQFISLGIEINGKTEYRSYSLSSIPDENQLQLTIKKVPNGLMSNYVVDKLNIGDSVSVLPPAGEFNCVDYPPATFSGRKKALMLSAGCGITPVYSMAKYLLHNDDVDITFVHTALDLSNTIYLYELETLNNHHDNFQLQLLLQDAENSHHHEGWLDQEWLERLVPDIRERSIYLCGPSQFMIDVKSYLQQLSVDMSLFHQESFTPATNEPEQSDTDSKSTYTVSVPKFGANLSAGENSLLADSLEQAGLPIILACRSGICGSCKCKVNKGKVTSSSQSPLTESEINNGYVLACSSTIESDVEIELG
ncbi:hybrid-cluster NAD(P)-dependent oxidoreductase [Vibrio marisflavi]|uniref:NADH oxidoreductase HCR n=1 Tax=Vibrio marisflavi CECT 7928 TaxID=634439 RepID=A0ABN8E708_9VIBR|nr:hybrid-cluster NAD(P)-dependent oxidoreductase [Vibrio marisflavi]CAH0539648.1 NADH oxidoreductase HCR [Vibrio marisflavi CECT 7928]